MKPLATLAFALTSAVALATSAQADSNYIVELGVQSIDRQLELSTVTATSAGNLQVFDYRLGTRGALIGEQAVNAGAHKDVRVRLAPNAFGDVLAVLYDTNGNIVAAEVVKRR